MKHITEIPDLVRGLPETGAPGVLSRHDVTPEHLWTWPASGVNAPRDAVAAAIKRGQA